MIKQQEGSYIETPLVYKTKQDEIEQKNLNWSENYDRTVHKIKVSSNILGDYPYGGDSADTWNDLTDFCNKHNIKYTTTDNKCFLNKTDIENRFESGYKRKSKSRKCISRI